MYHQKPIGWKQQFPTVVQAGQAGGSQAGRPRGRGWVRTAAARHCRAYHQDHEGSAQGGGGHHGPRPQPRVQGHHRHLQELPHGAATSHDGDMWGEGLLLMERAHFNRYLVIFVFWSPNVQCSIF